MDRHTPALVAAEGVSLLRGPSAGAPLPAPLAFRAVVDIYRKTANGAYLLAKTKDGRWGWLSQTDVLTSQDCMRVDPVNNPALRKVILHNGWQLKNVAQEVDFFDFPARSQVIVKEKIANFYYVFAERATPAGGKVLLLGSDPQWDAVRPDICIAGWVPEGQVARWYSRLALWYNQANAGQREAVKIFQSVEDLDLYLRDGTARNVIAQEGPHGVCSSTTPGIPSSKHASTTRRPEVPP
jgi:hypothetical protein